MNDQQTKSNIIKVSIGVIMTIAGIFIAFTSVDDRYAHATGVSRQISTIEQQIQTAVVLMREKQLEDYIFTYEFKVQTNQSTPLDRALLERYKREIHTILFNVKNV